MGANDHIDIELHDAIEELVSEGQIEKETLGYRIAQQVIHQGYETLSPAQKHSYDSEILPALSRLAEQHEMNRIDLSNPR